MPTIHGFPVTRTAARLLLLLAITAAVVTVLATRLGPLPPLGILLDPVDGLYRTARLAVYDADTALRLDGLTAAVTVIRDERGVPHIFAESDEDALMALGYVTAQDRLFQMDFLRRVAAGRLSEALGEATLGTDRFLRATGMELGVHRTMERLRADAGPALGAIRAFQRGANAFVASLEPSDWPLEYRLIGFAPTPFVPEDAIRLLQFMAFDLTFRSDDPAYGVLREALGDSAFFDLYPLHSRQYVPIIPEIHSGAPARVAGPAPSEVPVVSRADDRHPVAEGFREGKGSNSWAVTGSRSTTGRPLLAGDVHLGLTLPSIWYEVHLSTPTMNVYGVTIPGAPLPVIGFNDKVGWTFTNTGGDQIDYYFLETDESRARYRTADGMQPFRVGPDTIFVRGRAPVIDTLRYGEWGPAELLDEGALAFQWTAHHESRTVEALWEIVHSRSVADVDSALRKWDTPLQNVLYADVFGSVAMRVAGRVPVRRGGHGIGIARGETGAFDWTGFVPFEEMPSARNPGRGYLASSNQQPVDASYPYYLGYDWHDAWRSLRIDSLLRVRDRHDVSAFRGYQSDVAVVQHDQFAPLLDTLRGLSPSAENLRRLLVGWDGRASRDAPEPLPFDEFLLALERFAWDEPIFAGSTPDRITSITIASMRHGRTVTGEVPTPSLTTLLHLLRNDPDSRWLDVTSTSRHESAAGLLVLALEAAADSMTAHFGADSSAWHWGTHHALILPHITRSPSLRALGRGPFSYPGFAGTISPAGDRLANHSAAWRMVVDFSTTPPTGYGVLPGGPSGNPFSRFYAREVARYLSFELNPLPMPESPDALQSDGSRPTVRLLPAADSSSRNVRERRTAPSH